MVYYKLSYVRALEREGQSRLGIASLVIAIFSILLIFFIFLVAGAWEATVPGGIDTDSAAAVILGLFLFGCLGLNLVSIGLGIAGIFQRTRVRILAIIGTSLSTSAFAITLSILALGMT